jgi:hypothetical protein
MDARNAMNFPCVVSIRSLHPDYMTLDLRAAGLILCLSRPCGSEFNNFSNVH